jgi:hypothetical protein
MSRHAFHAPLLLTALLMWAATPASTQSSRDVVSPETLLLQLGPDSGSEIRVASPGRPRIEGQLQRVADSSLDIGQAGRDVRVPIYARDTVWLRGRATKRGAKVGAAVGLGLAGAATALFFSYCKSGTDDPCTGKGGLVTLGVFSVGLGGLFGAGVGALFPQWHRRIP